MRIPIFDKTGAKRYTVPVGDNSVYVWKFETEEYIQVTFTSDRVLQLKKGWYTDIDGLGRFEIVTLPTPTASTKADGYDYELRMDRPWYKFKNRTIFMRRGSVLGMESKWDLTDTIQAHAGILTDNLTKLGFTYKGDNYHVVIHDGVDTEKSVLISYDATDLLSAISLIAEAFETEWWIQEDAIHFGRCEQGDKEIQLTMHSDISRLTRSEDSSSHGTRLYAFGSSRNINQNYRRKLKNPFTVNGWVNLYGTEVTFECKQPTAQHFYSKSMTLEVQTGAYKGQRFAFEVISGQYQDNNGTEVWNQPIFRMQLPVAIGSPGITNGDKVRFIIGDQTSTQSESSDAELNQVKRDAAWCFSFKDLELPQKAVTERSTITLADGTGVKKLAYVGVQAEDAEGTKLINEGRELYKFTDGSQPKSTKEQTATLAHLSMMYVNKLYTEPIDGQADVAIQGLKETTNLMLPIDTPYVDSPDIDDDDEIVEIHETNEDIYPRCLLEITEITTVNAKETNEDTGEVTYWKAYRFKAKKKQDGTPFEFDESYVIQEDDKPLSVHFQSGKLSGMEFEVHFNPEGESGEKQLFEITRNDTYTIDLPNEVACPQVGDTLYMFNMDASFIDDALIPAAETELLEWAKKEIVKLCRDSGTYTASTNPVEWGRRRLGRLTYGQKVNLNAPHLVLTKDGTRSSRIIGWNLTLEDLTQGEYTIGESSAYSRNENLSNDVQELVYYNGQIKNGNGGVNIQLYDKLITQLQRKVEALENVMDTKLSRVAEDTARKQITMQGGLKVGDFVSGKFGKGARIDEAGNTEVHSLTVREFIETPEFRFNRINISIGNDWRAPGGGIIESVTPDTDSEGNELTTGTLTLKLEDGEIGTIKVDDICQGIYHDGLDLGNNATEYGDDGIGNFKFPGFYTCYFRITEITAPTTKRTARYSLRPKSGNYPKPMHPKAAMHFVAYGNFTDKERQTSRYSTRTYDRYLTGVNSWEFQSSNVAAQFGDLTNLSVFGLNMTGYSGYMDNLYFNGTVAKIENRKRRMTFDHSMGTILAKGEQEIETVHILDGYGDDHADEYTFKVERDSGDGAADAVWNAKAEHLNCGKQFIITWDDLHIREGGSVSTLFEVTATDGIESVTNNFEI